VGHLSQAGTPSRAYDAEKERQRKADYRARKNDPDAGKPWEGLAGEEREQAIRDYYGYGPSERRTQAERLESTDRIIARSAARRAAAWEIRKQQAASQPVTRKGDPK